MRYYTCTSFEVIEKTNLNPAGVGDIVVGYVLGSGSQRARECRMAAFYAGFPGLRTVNRQRSSVLQAVADVAASIKPGFYDIGIGAGLESMTAYPMAWDRSVNPRSVICLYFACDCFTSLWRDEEGTRPGCGINVVAGLLTGKDQSVKDTLGSGKEEGLRLILQLQCNVMNDQPQIRPRSDLTKVQMVGVVKNVEKDRFRYQYRARIDCMKDIDIALRLILQCGVKPSWFNTYSSIINKGNSQLSKSASSSGDLRSYLIDIPTIGDSVVPELLLKVLEPYQREGEVPGSILDDERVRQYATILDKGSAARFSFAAAIFVSEISSSSETDDASLLSRISSKGKSATSSSKRNTVSDGELRLMAFEQEELWESANERIPWHERLDDEEAIQNRVHELVSIGNLEAAVSLMLSTPPKSPYFYPNALPAVALLSAVSRSLNELAVKVVAANMVETDRSLSGTHMLCAVGRYQEACSQVQYDYSSFVRISSRVKIMSDD
ncbi:transducin/WD40 repeat family protein [Tanacetum coccineum]|uniref:Transducin/WD40 repeat family protein n=1 Tax=Tanacetum coccineum TaxID=301880 RepID=A0ABQ5ATS5_9ASTR